LNAEGEIFVATCVRFGWDGRDDGVRPYDKRAIVERRELVPQSMGAGRELGEKIADLSE
jgi:hypothetical protein